LSKKNPVRAQIEQAEEAEDSGFDLYGQGVNDDGRPDPAWEAEDSSNERGHDLGALTVDELDNLRVCADLDQNDRDNGRRLIIWYGPDLAYVSGMGWLLFRGTHWERDEGDLAVRLKAQDLVDWIKRELWRQEPDCLCRQDRPQKARGPHGGRPRGLEQGHEGTRPARKEAQRAAHLCDFIRKCRKDRSHDQAGRQPKGGFARNFGRQQEAVQRQERHAGVFAC
jgi:hypothetical protein